MKVKFVTTYPPANCGIAIYSQHYVEALRKLCDVDVLPIERPKMDPFYFIGLALKARKGADVVHVQFDCGFFGTIGRGRLSLSGMYVPLFYFMLKLPGGPAVATTVHELHDARKDYAGRLLYWPMRTYYTLVYRPMMRLSDAVIAHTTGTVQALAQYGRTHNAAIVPHASFIKPVVLAVDECKDKLGLRGKRVVTIFGYISPPKGHDLAIEAMKGMPDDVVLYIAGDGRAPEDKRYVEELKAKARSLGLDGRVRFHGYVKEEEMPVVMCASDVMLMPYRHVVQSGALYYALAYGKPVLASDTGGFAEMAGSYGCIETFEPDNAEDLTVKLASLMANDPLKRSIVKKGALYIGSISIDRVAAATLNIYEKIMGR